MTTMQQCQILVAKGFHAILVADERQKPFCDKLTKKWCIQVNSVAMLKLSDRQMSVLLSLT
ncbi:hypothetical protein PLA107_030455 (plasmid) [Pseudomonas amygdali pv. lachrymans str. M301315]|uniref:Uncharacterized protein n=1 Tax=Pseudomonas amygdali pv. lachrymans str. M301315 TaxID=629260 RepID=A0AAD0M6Z0_PSEAV|nr:hypothetical protein PLA107_030455 [Pseudomonas amygdali pv. lachrymans str. M301315]